MYLCVYLIKMVYCTKLFSELFAFLLSVPFVLKGSQHNKTQAQTEENTTIDNLQQVIVPDSGDHANNNMELNDTSRIDPYSRINIGRPDVEGSATDTEQYEIPDVPSQNRFDNLHQYLTPVSEDYANKYMELDDTSRVDTYDTIAICRPDVEGSATDTEQYETPDVPSQNRRS